jgi:hypothetical protein
MSEPSSEPPPKPVRKSTRKSSRQAGLRDWLFSLFADPIKILTQPIKLPGWAAILFAVFVFFPDWHARIDFWLHVVQDAGGRMSTIAGAIASPYFSPTLAIAGVLWVLFVGEPTKGVQRRHWLRYVGWSIFLICATTVIVLAGYGALEFYIQKEIGSRDRALQDKAATRPIFWRLTDAEKTALGFELDQIPEAERFELKFKCLPDAGSRTFVEDIAKLINDHKWKISANCLFSNVRPDLTGLYISISKIHEGKPFEKMPKDIRTLATILAAANIPGKGYALDDGMKEDEFYLVVGNAP